MKYLLLTLFLFGGIISQAQDWSKDVYQYGELYPGYIIDEDGNKTEGYIKYRNRYVMQNEVLFYTDPNNKKSKEKYKSQDLKEYMVADKLYHCINYSGGLSKKAVRGNLVLNIGCISEYVYYMKEDGAEMMVQGSSESWEDFLSRKYPSTLIYYKEGDEQPRDGSYFLNFAKKMSLYIEDYAELSEKVANKEKGYRMLAINKIIAEYNENCAK